MSAHRDDVAPDAASETLFSHVQAYTPSVHAPPPYSVIDACSGWWQTRRRYWSALGCVDAGDRASGENMGAFNSSMGDWLTPKASIASGNTEAVTFVSSFSPVLSEVLLSWYSDSVVWDPFCGGPVRGFVAHALGREYIGVDLRDDQILSNCEAFPALVDLWHVGDALESEPPEGVDCAFTCPPYHDLEIYSDDPRDLSAMSWDSFVATHREVIGRTADALGPGGFAVWVVGDVRARSGPPKGASGGIKRGVLRGLPDLVAQQMSDAGLLRWNRHVVRTPLGTAPMRVFAKGASPWLAAKRMLMVHSEVVVGRKPE